jgi:hypothetical protein
MKNGKKKNSTPTQKIIIRIRGNKTCWSIFKCKTFWWDKSIKKIRQRQLWNTQAYVCDRQAYCSEKSRIT